MNSPIRRSFKQIGALPFVCPGSVEHLWSLLKPNIPSDMAEFVDYFERTWIGTSSTLPLFDHWFWNHYDTVLAGLPRSNKIVEGWHNGFQQLVGHSNPNIWTFLKALKREDTLTFVKKVKMMNREAPLLQPMKWSLYNQRLDAVVEDYGNYTDPLDYLKCVGELLYLDIFHVIVLCETDLLFNKLYLQIYYRFVIQI